MPITIDFRFSACSTVLTMHVPTCDNRKSLKYPVVHKVEKQTPIFRMPIPDIGSYELTEKFVFFFPNQRLNVTQTALMMACLVRSDNILHVGIELLENWLRFNFGFHDTNHVCLVLALISEIAVIMFHRFDLNIY